MAEAEAGLRQRLKLRLTASDAEFKAVFDAANAIPPQSDKAWNWKDLLTSIKGPRRPPTWRWAANLRARSPAWASIRRPCCPAPGSTRSERRSRRAISTGPGKWCARWPRRRAASFHRLSADAAFAERRQSWVDGYAKIMDSAVKRDPKAATSLLASDAGRVYLLLDAATGINSLASSPLAGEGNARGTSHADRPVLARRPRRPGHRRLARHRQDDRRRLHRRGRQGLHLLAQGRRRATRPPRSCRAAAEPASPCRRTSRRSRAARRWPRALAEHEPKLDILVNNAGAAWGAEFDEFPRERLGQGDEPEPEVALLPHPGAARRPGGRGLARSGRPR